MPAIRPRRSTAAQGFISPDHPTAFDTAINVSLALLLYFLVQRIREQSAVETNSDSKAAEAAKRSDATAPASTQPEAAPVSKAAEPPASAEALAADVQQKSPQSRPPASSLQADTSEALPRLVPNQATAPLADKAKWLGDANTFEQAHSSMKAETAEGLRAAPNQAGISPSQPAITFSQPSANDIDEEAALTVGAAAGPPAGAAAAATNRAADNRPAGRPVVDAIQTSAGGIHWEDRVPA